MPGPDAHSLSYSRGVRNTEESRWSLKWIPWSGCHAPVRLASSRRVGK